MGNHFFKFGNPSSVNMKEFINFYVNAFYVYWQSIHNMLKAVVYDVNCTSDAYKVSFYVILNFIEYIIMSSSINTAKVSVAIVRTKSNLFIFVLFGLELKAGIYLIFELFLREPI